jgi:methionine salvage enolase-phosphatase E1
MIIDASHEVLLTWHEETQSTILERLQSLVWHETYHIGQLEPLRQLAGKNDKII